MDKDSGVAHPEAPGTVVLHLASNAGPRPWHPRVLVDSQTFGCDACTWFRHGTQASERHGDAMRDRSRAVELLV